MQTRQLNSTEEMQEFGFDFASKLNGGDVVLLHGDLGAGKTTLTKGIAKYFGIDEVVSPTFTLIQTYEIQNSEFSLRPELSSSLSDLGVEDRPRGIQNLVHIDTYRLDNEEQLIDIGIEDYLGEKNTVCVIEWPEKMEGLLGNKKVVNVWIKHSAHGRVVEIQD